MRIQKVYLETSALNFVFADDSPDKKMDTLKLFEEIRGGKYLSFTSSYVTEEVDKAPADKREGIYKLIIEHKTEILQKTEEIKRLAGEYVKEGIIPEKHMIDALHIATAAVYDLDMILSWNFQHIVKRKTIIMTESVNLRNGYKKVEIYSPSEVIEDV